jgi:phage gp36-like protein
MPRYATTTDLARIGIASNALASLDTAAKEDALDACSSLADGYLSGRYTLPLSAWADDLRLHVAGMAAFRLLAARGYNPQVANDEVIRLLWEDAIRWLERVAAGTITPAGISQD